MPIALLESDIEKITRALSDKQKDVLKAGLISGWSTQFYSPKEYIKDQISDSSGKELDAIIQGLMNFKPHLLERGVDGSNCKFTKMGASVAKEIMNSVEPYVPPTTKPIRIVNPYTGKGENNKAMIAYAQEHRLKHVRSESKRCNFCGHGNLVFIKKGGKLLCQECFRNNVRF